MTFEDTQKVTVWSREAVLVKLAGSFYAQKGVSFFSIQRGEAASDRITKGRKSEREEGGGRSGVIGSRIWEMKKGEMR